MVKNSPANARDLRDEGSIPVSGRSPGVGNGKPLQYSYLGNPQDRKMWLVMKAPMTEVVYEVNSEMVLTKGQLLFEKGDF